MLGVGLKVDKLLSRQRLIADVNINESTYDKNTNLDFVGGEGRLAWLWQIGNYWSGEASYRKRRQLGGFSDVRQNVQDLIDTDIYVVSAGYQFHPRWRISADLTEEDSVHSAPTRANLDFSSHAVGTDLPAGLVEKRGGRPENTTLRPRDYHHGLAVALAVTWLAAAAVAVFTRYRDSHPTRTQPTPTPSRT